MDSYVSFLEEYLNTLFDVFSSKTLQTHALAVALLSLCQSPFEWFKIDSLLNRKFQINLKRALAYCCLKTTVESLCYLALYFISDYYYLPPQVLSLAGLVIRTVIQSPLETLMMRTASKKRIHLKDLWSGFPSRFMYHLLIHAFSNLGWIHEFLRNARSIG